MTTGVAPTLAESRTSSSFGYMPALDGVRAVAIFGVLVFHSMPAALPGGFTGVDVFFVLSGYLISSVILHDLAGGKFSMREFYFRRIQRLLPNAALTVLFTVALSSIALLPSQTVKVATHGLWTIFNVSNLYIWRNVGGYWGDSAASVPLLHTWSLAVEEQFYLLFPALLLFLSRRTHLFKITASLLLLSLALSIYGTGTHPVATFYLLPTRAWEPFMGAALAALMASAKDVRRWMSKSSPLLEFAGWAGLATIVAGFLLISDASRFPGFIALVPTLGALAVLVSVAEGQSTAARLLAKPFPVLIGKLSYSLYLWHWPLIVIAREYAYLTDRSQQTWTLIGAAVGVVLSLIAYWVVEQPLRQRGPGRRRRLQVICVGFSICAVACLSLSLRRPVADPDHLFERPAFYGSMYTVGPWDQDLVTSSVRLYDVLFPPEPVHPPEMWTNGGIIHAWGGGTPRVVVLGSSHAIMYGRLIDDICKRLGLSVAFLSADAAPVFFPSVVNARFPTPALARSFDAARRKWVSQWNPDAILVMDRWDSYADAPAGFNQKLWKLAGELSPHSRNVILFSQVPVLRLGETENLREYVAWCLRTTGHLPKIAPDPLEPFRRTSIATIAALTHDFPNVHLLRVERPFYMDDGSVRFFAGRKFFYTDDDHLSEAGTEMVRGICTQAIAAATRPSLWEPAVSDPGLPFARGEARPAVTGE
jgi:peptidoglycan/LPS O-acetylase OafA/YrhL